MASSASTEQWIFTGGSASSFTISVFLIFSASSTVLPFTHSVASDDDAIAEPQPKVLNFASSMTPVSGLTLICSFITSPHSGAPTRPVPTSCAVLVERADVARILVVIEDLVAVCHVRFSPEFQCSVSSNHVWFATSFVTFEACNDSVRLLACPLHVLQIDAFFRHLVQRRQLAQPFHRFDDAVGHVIDFASVLKRPRPKRIELCARSSPAPSAFST